MLRFEDINRLVRLHHRLERRGHSEEARSLRLLFDAKSIVAPVAEQNPAARTESAEIPIDIAAEAENVALARAAEGIAGITTSAESVDAAETPEQRKKRKAAERAKRFRDKQKASSESVTPVTPVTPVTLSSVTQRDVTHHAARNALHHAERDGMRDDERDGVTQISGDSGRGFAQPASTAGLSKIEPQQHERDASVTVEASVTLRNAVEGAQRDAERDGDRDDQRDASRLGGKGGVVAVRGKSFSNNELQREDLENSARAKRDDDRDASRSVTLALVTQPAVAVVLPELKRTNARLGRLKKNVSDYERRLQIAVELVFGYWISKTGRDERTLLSPEREKCIVTQLRLNGMNVSELCFAIDGVRGSKFHMGGNDFGQVFDEVTTIFKDRTQVEKLARNMGAYRAREEHPVVIDAREELAATVAQSKQPALMEEAVHA